MGQGGVLSPILFTINVDDAVAETKAKSKQIRIEYKNLDTVCTTKCVCVYICFVCVYEICICKEQK